jgi:hypothetical protein
MSVDEQSGFVADGGDSVTTGYGTNSNSLAFGVNVSGYEVGVVGRGAVGMEGYGQNGPGGKFGSSAASDNEPVPAQLNLVPQQTRNPGTPSPATPSEFNDPVHDLPGAILPQIGHVGDLLFTNDPNATAFKPNTNPPHSKLARVGAALWICVRASVGEPMRTNFQQAFWCQVLLGDAYEGHDTISDL